MSFNPQYKATPDTVSEGQRSTGTIDSTGALRVNISSSGPETTSTPVAVTLVANTAKDLLAANASRVRFSIANPLATTLYVRKATLADNPATASAGGYDFYIPSGAQYISDPKEWAGGLNGICATAGDVNVSESV
jgi:hypothetical protein